MSFDPPDNAPEDYYASLPFPEAQRALTGGPQAGTSRGVTLTWHGTKMHPGRGAYAVVLDTGALTDLVGRRIKVTYRPSITNPRVVYVYVAAALAGLASDISLARRAFAALAPLGDTSVVARIETLRPREA